LCSPSTEHRAPAPGSYWLESAAPIARNTISKIMLTINPLMRKVWHNLCHDVTRTATCYNFLKKFTVVAYCLNLIPKKIETDF
jgi:hypothetical protein